MLSTGAIKMTSKSILVSELTHSSLFLLQAKLMVSDKKKYSMNHIINKLLVLHDEQNNYDKLGGYSPLSYKLENIET